MLSARILIFYLSKMPIQTNDELLNSTGTSAQCYAAAWRKGSLGEMDTCICTVKSLHSSPETVTRWWSVTLLYQKLKKKMPSHPQPLFLSLLQWEPLFIIRNRGNWVLESLGELFERTKSSAFLVTVVIRCFVPCVDWSFAPFVDRQSCKVVLCPL